MGFMDAEFPEKLKSGFANRYDVLVQDGFYGDELFMELMASMDNGHSDLSYQAACLSILVYLFQKCEIFEK